MFTDFIILYPLVMTMFWIVGTIFYQSQKTSPPVIAEQHEGVSVLVPCFNEEAHLERTFESLAAQQHQNIEIILIDDSSTDNTLEIMHNLQKKYSRLNIKIIPQKENLGKASAMNTGIQHAQFDFVLGIDADSILDSNAIDQLVYSLKQNPKMAGVTGRPQVINRNNLVEKMQTMEYTAIIDLIKRSQTFFTGNILTISGVIAMFRKDAVLSIGGWDPNVQTEDIDITWRLSQQGFSVSYNPNALTWILVPFSFRALLKQRRRWAYGGLQMLLKNKSQLLKPFQMKSLLLYEMILSIFWSFTTVFSVGFFFVNIYLAKELHLDGNIILMIVFMGLIQFLIGLSLTKKTAQIRWFVYLYIPLYLFFYWIINLYALITSVFKMVYMPDNHGKWSPPQRIVADNKGGTV